MWATWRFARAVPSAEVSRTADPAAELPALATLFDATFTIVGPSGAREVPWSEFFVTFLTSCLEADVILTGVTLTLPPRAAGWSFREIARRHGDFALAGCAAVVELEAGGTAIANARVALFGVDATPVRLLDAEPQLAGLAPGDPAIDDIAADAAAKLEPNADIHGSSEFRRDIARSLIASGIRDAARHAGRARMSDEKHPVAFTLNGTRRRANGRRAVLLSDFLRHDLEFTGTHVGCEHGVCGSCTVLVDGEPARSCLMLAVQADGRTIETGREPRTERRHALAAAIGVSQASRTAVRILYAGLSHDGRPRFSARASR